MNIVINTCSNGLSSSEHRNMPIEDALTLMSRNFQEVQRGGARGREAVYALLGQLADGRALTVLQYDKVIEYLQVHTYIFSNPISLYIKDWIH